MQYLKKKILLLEFFTILKCVTKWECVTSKVPKDARGYCTKIYNLISNKLGLNLKFGKILKSEFIR